MRAIKADPVKLELVKINLPLRRLEKRIDTVPLNDREYFRYQKFAAKPDGRRSLYDTIKLVMFGTPRQRKSWAMLSTGQKQTLVKNAIAPLRQAAKIMMIDAPEYEEEFSELRGKVREMRARLEEYGRQTQ
jgi:ABC-type uncharacterized transport system ATPase subunit